MSEKQIVLSLTPDEFLLISGWALAGYETIHHDIPVEDAAQSVEIARFRERKIGVEAIASAQEKMANGARDGKQIILG